MVKDFNEVYKSICEALLNAHQAGNTKEINNLTFTVRDINTCASTIRNMSLPYVCGELLWYLRGSNDVKFISKFGSMWERLSDDGLTNNSAYGYILKYKHGFNQIEKMVELLKKDPLSRRAVININVPNPNVIETRDEPCTIALQFLLRDGKLHCTGMMRSNDIWFGLPYDIVFFTTIQKIIADKLGVEYGTYTHFATSLHMYDRDRSKIEEILQNNSIQHCEINHKLLYEQANELYDLIKKSDNPKEDIIREFKSRGILNEII